MKELEKINAQRRATTCSFWTWVAATLALATFNSTSYAEQPPAPCFPNPHAARDSALVRNRGDIRNLPEPLKKRIVRMADRPHSILPTQAFAEADKPSQLFEYYLIDTNEFQANIFTSVVPGINDAALPTAANQANCGLSSIGSVRVVLEPKQGLPTDPNNPKAFIDVFTDISGLFVINNESGCYEGWMIHDLAVAPVNAMPRRDGHAPFGAILLADAAILKRMGNGNNVPCNLFTIDGNSAHLPNATDHFPDRQSNVVPLYVSMGTYNTLQQSDTHPYWE